MYFYSSPLFTIQLFSNTTPTCYSVCLCVLLFPLSFSLVSLFSAFFFLPSFIHILSSHTPTNAAILPRKLHTDEKHNPFRFYLLHYNICHTFPMALFGGMVRRRWWWWWWLPKVETNLHTPASGLVLVYT